MPNRLIHSTSPYLLQHAHNPVDWHPWNEETLQKARLEDKMLLISIGYSACHWCHVMERESFEDRAVAEIMNRHYVCIKVDREERPDVDQVYMNALQLLTGSGGWPLNCFALPNGKPFFGGTYFRKEQWKNLLENIAILFEARRADLEQQAESITEGIREDSMIIAVEENGRRNAEEIVPAVGRLSQKFDMKEGGLAGSPKFPMPVVLDFLLDFYLGHKDEKIADFIKLTLKKMAFGGIYDQLGGGFARYSTDAQWKVPHFEKMLYDNAQLVSVYSRAHQVFLDPLYKEVVEETLAFIRREMTSPEGAFYTALDADSEGVEGKYYTWKAEEIRDKLEKQAELVMKYYNVGGKGLWEDGRNILMRGWGLDEFLTLQGFKPLHRYRSILNLSRQKLLKARSKRIKPGLDNKILTSWNALMIKGYIDAYLALGIPDYLASATMEMEFLLESVARQDGGLYHQAGSGSHRINGFLDDYAFMIDALTNLYQAGFEEEWLYKAQELANYVIKYFYDEDTGLFYYTSRLDNELIARKTELYDNVIPSSNSVMARALLHLGLAFDLHEFIEISQNMMTHMKPFFLRHPASFSNWGSLWLEQEREETVIAVCGPEFREKISEIRKMNVPGILFFGSKGPSGLSYLQNRFVEGRTMIYYCTGKECRLPAEDPVEIKNLLTPPITSTY